MKTNYINYLIVEKKFTEETALKYNQQNNEFRTWRRNKKLAISYDEMIDYIEHLNKRKLSYSFINQKLIAIKYYIDYRQYKVNPINLIQLKGREKKVLTGLLTPEQLVNIYQEFKDLKYSNPNLYKRNTVIIGLFCFQGVKPNEVSKIKLSGINLNKFTIQIPATTRTNSRVLRIQPEQIIDIYNYLQESRMKLVDSIGLTDSEYLITGNKRENDVTTIINKLKTTLKENSCYFNSLLQIRNSVIVNWIKGNNLRMVQYMAGHKYVSSTEKYKINDMSELQKKVLKFHPFSDLE